jgi:short-subunit dehydrogenase
MALHGLFDVLRSELGPHGISVSIVVPGFVRTEISQHAVTATGGEHGQLSGHQASGDTPEECAEKILRGLARRRREFLVSTAPKLWVGVVLRRIAPGLFWKMLARTDVT